MIFLKLTINRGLFSKEFGFGDTTLIYSTKNSVGKTTLLRMLLYSLGYPIPNTKGLQFSDYEYILCVTTDDGIRLELNRINDYLIISNGSSEVKGYSLPVDLNKILRRVFGISNPNILNNLLGCFYADQEKGWTLLNRGKVIGSIPFKIENLVLGVSSRFCDDLESELDGINSELKKFEYMFSTAKYKKQLAEHEGEVYSESESDMMEKDLQVLRMKRQSLEKEASRIKKVIRQNDSFKEFITDMKIYVKSDDGKRIPVNEHTIIDFEDNMDFIITKRNLINDQIVSLDNRIGSMKKKILDSKSIFNVRTTIEDFDESISKIDIDYAATERIIAQLKKNKKEISALITEYVKQDNDVVGKLHSLISSYAKELGIDESHVSPNRDYIFTSDLKSLSGTIYHKIVLSFKLAYIRIIFEYTGVRLPIILDSPSGREIKASEVSDMINLIVREFSEHQIIIASIHKYDLINPKIILLNNSLLEF